MPATDDDPHQPGTALGFTVDPSSPAHFGKLIAEETEKWAKVTKFAGAQR